MPRKLAPNPATQAHSTPVTTSAVPGDTEPKEGGEAIGVLDQPLKVRPTPRKAHHRAKHKDLPPPDQPEARAEYVANQFRQQATNAAAAEKRATSEGYEPGFASRREGSKRYSANQLSIPQIAAIKADYMAGVMPVDAICLGHHISKPTLYALAEKQAWPLRSEIQRQMQEAVQANVVAATTRELRIEMHGPSGEDRPLLSQMVEGAMERMQGFTGAAELLPRDSEDQPQTARTIEDVANQDMLTEEYGLAVGLVLAKHRQMASKAIQACDTLLQVHTEAIAQIKDRAQDMARDPVSLAKLLEPMAKSLALMLANTQKAVELQRQALALDLSAGKGVALGDLERVRAAHAGMKVPEDGPSTGNATIPAGAMSLPAGMMGTYEELVREAERRGTRLA